MEEYQQYVIDEKQELDNKLQRLITFVSENPIFDALSEPEKDFMKIQADAMALYSKALACRISLFK